jgi:hypothetical protein
LTHQITKRTTLNSRGAELCPGRPVYVASQPVSPHLARRVQKTIPAKRTKINYFSREHDNIQPRGNLQHSHHQPPVLLIRFEPPPCGGASPAVYGRADSHSPARNRPRARNCPCNFNKNNILPARVKQHPTARRPFWTSPGGQCGITWPILVSHRCVISPDLERRIFVGNSLSRYKTMNFTAGTTFGRPCAELDSLVSWEFVPPLRQIRIFTPDTLCRGRACLARRERTAINA